MSVYADESCKDDHRYLALGGLCLQHCESEGVLDHLRAVRELHNTYGEVKWTKVSRSKLGFYKDFVDVYFDLAKADTIHFHSLYVDTSTFNHREYNGGDRDLGFNKLIYQLLLHKFGCKYGGQHPLHVYLDQRATKHNPESLRPMLNADLRKWGIASNPFRRLSFQDSKDTDLLQLTDLLVGVIGYKMNRHDKKTDAAPHKIELARHILDRAWENDRPHRLHQRGAKRFTVWNFQFRKR